MKNYRVAIISAVLFTASICCAKDSLRENEEYIKSADWPNPTPSLDYKETELLEWVEISMYPYVWSYKLGCWCNFTEEVESVEDGTWVLLFNL